MHAEIQADLSLYAIGVLGPEARATLEQHLAQGCAECERELGVWREVAGALALVDKGGAAPDLKARLMHQARAAEAVGPSLPEPRRTPAWVQVGLPLAAAVLMALYAVLREGEREEPLQLAQEQVEQLQGDLDRNAKRAASLQVKVDHQQEEIMLLTGELAARDRNAEIQRLALADAESSLAVLHNPGLQMVRLAHTADSPKREAHVLINRGSGRAIFYGFDLKAMSPDKAYAMWWVTEKKGSLKAGLFRPDARGIGRLESALPSDAGVLQAVAVSIEPAAGGATPTGPTILSGRLIAPEAKAPVAKKSGRKASGEKARTSKPDAKGPAKPPAKAPARAAPQKRRTPPW